MDLESPSHVQEGDINPRSPKRQRLSPPDTHNAKQDTRDKASTEASSSNIATDLSSTADVAQDEQSNSKSPQGPALTGQPAPYEPQQIPPDPSRQTRLDNLAILSNLSSQLLSVLARMPPAEALQLSRAQATPHAREYQLIRSLFNPVRQLYLQNTPFIRPLDLNMTDTEQVEILRKANQAMYMTSIFTGELGLRDMDQNFLEVFVPEQGRLLKALGSIYLELKTQAFITANRTGAAEPLAVMSELFPPDMEAKLFDRRSGQKGIAPSEQDFLQRLSSRREILLSDVKNKTVDQLPLRYRWEDLSREVSGYLAKNFGPAAINPANAADVNTSQVSSMTASQPQYHLLGEFSMHEPPMPAGAVSFLPYATSQIHTSTPPMVDMDDFVAQAARAAEIAMQGPPPAFEPPRPAKPPPPEPISYSKIDPQFQHYTPATSNGSTGRGSPFPLGQDEVPHGSQTAPTRVLYERARQATIAKGSPVNKKPVTPSQRRPWTPEEESALMTGLDHVKGPHWSQILAMYGPGGTVNESLKDRNQVQLKDKARNLKLFFLKAGIEVPYYLKYVTGDLRTRAPGQAERQEARERERLQSDDQRAHCDGIQGIMALASATQTPGESESPAMSPFEADEGDEGEGGDALHENAADSGEPDMNDIEAMISRAAAQASEAMPPA